LEDERQKYCQGNRGYYLDTCEASVATHQQYLQAAIQQAVDKEGTGTVVSIVAPTDIDSVSELNGQPRHEAFPATRDEHCCCPTHFTGQRVSEWMEFAGWKPVTRLYDGPDGKTVQTDLWTNRPCIFGNSNELPLHMVDGMNEYLKFENDLVTRASSTGQLSELCADRSDPSIPLEACKLNISSARPHKQVLIQNPNAATSAD
jgi:hypothetical protein